MIQGPTGISPDVLQLEPGLMIDVTLWYLALGSMFYYLRWSFRLAPKTTSEVVWEAYQAIVDAFWVEFIVTSSTEAQSHAVAYVAIQKPPHAGSEF